MANPQSPTPDGRHRIWLLTSAWLSLAPLLLQLPPSLAGIIAITAVLTGLLAWKHIVPTPLRLVLVLTMLAAVYWQTGSRFGRDTGCALLAAMLAIKTSELHSLRDARSLLGFALFAPFSAFLLDQGPITMALALAAALIILLSMQRLTDQQGHVLRSAYLQFRAIVRFSLIGLPLALAAFWLFPRMGTPLWGIPERAMARPSLSDTMAPGQWLDLIADDSAALRVQFFGQTPTAVQRYWRGPVLDEFDGQQWRAPPRAVGGMPTATRPVPALWDYQIDYEPTEHRQLVALDLPLQAPAGTQLSPYDHVLRSDHALIGLTRWRLQSAPAAAVADTLPGFVRRRSLRLPVGYNPRTLALGRQWRQQMGDDDHAIVQRALDWISREFVYTLEPSPPVRDTADDFLFDNQAGYCQHFSSAFVILMRSAGIPARVVTGYAGGVYNRLGDYWIVRRMDAHAWAEVWLPQRGWVRIDPTAAVAPERILDTLDDRLGANADTRADAATRGWNLYELNDWIRRGWNDMVLAFDAGRQQQLLQPLGITRLEPWHLIMMFSAAMLMVLTWMIWLLARGIRERDPLLRAWHKLQHGYRRHGLAREKHEPAIQWAERVQRSRADPALLSLSQRFAEARYAATSADSTHAKLIKDLLRHRPSTGASR